MNKHDETKEHPMLGLGDKMCAIVLKEPESNLAQEILNNSHPLGLRSFIEGFS